MLVVDGKGKKMVEWKSIKIKDADMILYYNPINKRKKHGFYFYCIEAYMWELETEEILGCDCQFHGVAYFDGIRHLYFGDDQTENYGYLYYPCIEDLFLALKELQKLEIKYCTFD